MNYHDYHEDWRDIIRPKVLERDGYKCQHCGVKHKNYYIIQDGSYYSKIDADEYVEYLDSGVKCNRVYLQVAHLDCDKNNNNLNNLRSLCNLCHLKHDKQWKKMLRLSKKKINHSYPLQDSCDTKNQDTSDMV